MHDTITYIYFIGYVGGGLVTKSCPTLVIPWTVAHQGMGHGYLGWVKKLNVSGISIMSALIF